MDPNVVYQGLIDAGAEYAELDARAWQSEQMLKSLFSERVIAYREGGASWSESEHRARTGAAYKEAVAEHMSIRAAAQKAKSDWISRQAWCRLVQTSEASKRAEMNLSGIAR